MEFPDPFKMFGDDLRRIKDSIDYSLLAEGLREPDHIEKVLPWETPEARKIPLPPLPVIFGISGSEDYRQFLIRHIQTYLSNPRLVGFNYDQPPLRVLQDWWKDTIYIGQPPLPGVTSGDPRDTALQYIRAFLRDPRLLGMSFDRPNLATLERWYKAATPTGSNPRTDWAKYAMSG